MHYRPNGPFGFVMANQIELSLFYSVRDRDYRLYNIAFGRIKRNEEIRKSYNNIAGGVNTRKCNIWQNLNVL